MPFKSKKQMRYMYATNPDVAKEMTEKTKKEENIEDLPLYAKKKKKKTKVDYLTQ